MPSVFETALAEASTKLANAHHAQVSTLNAELQHMRRENTRLRARLAELEASPAAGAADVTSAATKSSAKVGSPSPASVASTSVVDKLPPTPVSAAAAGSAMASAAKAAKAGSSATSEKLHAGATPPTSASGSASSSVASSHSVTATEVVSAAAAGITVAEEVCPISDLMAKRRGKAVPAANKGVTEVVATIVACSDPQTAEGPQFTEQLGKVLPEQQVEPSVAAKPAERQLSSGNSAVTREPIVSLTAQAVGVSPELHSRLAELRGSQAVTPTMIQEPKAPSNPESPKRFEEVAPPVVVRRPAPTKDAGGAGSAQSVGSGVLDMSDDPLEARGVDRAVSSSSLPSATSTSQTPNTKSVTTRTLEVVDDVDDERHSRKDVPQQVPPSANLYQQQSQYQQAPQAQHQHPGRSSRPAVGHSAITGSSTDASEKGGPAATAGHIGSPKGAGSVLGASPPQLAAVAPAPEIQSVQATVVQEPVTAGSANFSESSAASSPEQPALQDLGRALEAVLAHYGWQHLAVQRLRPDVYSISGLVVRLRVGHSSAAPRDGGAPPCSLWASEDGGQTWLVLEDLVRERRLHKVVRTAPIPTGTREYQPERAPSSPMTPVVAMQQEVVHVVSSSSPAPAATPQRTPPVWSTSPAAASSASRSRTAPLSLAELAASAQHPYAQARPGPGQAAMLRGGGGPWPLAASGGGMRDPNAIVL